MEIAKFEVADISVLEPVDVIDSTNANTFTTKVTDIVSGQPGNFVIDLNRVKYVSSAGVRALILVGQVVAKMQRKLVLCGLNDEVARLFELTKLGEYFVIGSSRDDAVRLAK
jgi:anti-anti-sigma factor